MFAKPRNVVLKRLFSAARWRYPMRILLLAMLYWAAAQAGLLLAAVLPSHASPIWPAAGIGLGALLLFGCRLWPGVMLGGLLVNVELFFDVSTWGLAFKSAGLAVSAGSGVALQAVVGAFLIRRYVGFPSPLSHAGDVIKFLGLGGPLSCLISSTWGTTSMLLGGIITLADYPFSWWTWWIGDTLGVLIVTPLVLIGLGEPRPLWRRRGLTVGLPLIVTLVVVAVVFLYTQDQVRKSIRLRFENDAVVLAGAWNKELERYLDALYTIERFFVSSTAVNRQGFARFVERMLRRYPGIQALSWNPRVRNGERAAYEASGRRDGYTDFQITERGADGRLVRAGQRPEYISVAYIEPYAGNENALGYDIASNPTRREAILRARDTGRPAATARITLVQETSVQAGILVLLPIYEQQSPPATVSERRRRLLGYAVGVFRVGDMLAAALKPVDIPHLEVWLYDDSMPAATELLATYKTDTQQPVVITADLNPKSARDMLQWETGYDFAGRQWTLQLQPLPEYLAARRSWQSWWVLTGGFLFTGLLGFFQLVSSGRTVELARANTDLKQEVSERRRAEQALRESEEYYRLLFDRNPNPMWVHDKETLGFLAVNQAAIDHYGFSREEFMRMTVKDVRPLEDIPGFLELMAQSPDHLHQVKGWRHRKKDGALIDVEIGASPLRFQGRPAELILVIDVTERVQTERALRKNRQELLQAQQIAHLGSWSWDIDSGVNTWSEEQYRIFGYEPDEVEASYDLFVGHLHPEDRDRVLAAISEAVEKDTPYTSEYRIIRRDGAERWIEALGCVLRADDGRPLGMLGTVLDITERKQAEEALRQSEQRFREMADNIREVFWLFDWTARRVVYVSPAYETIWGRSVEALYQQYTEWGDSIHPDDLAYAEESFGQIAQGHEVPVREYRIVRPDGSVRWVSDQGFPITDEQGQIVRIVGIAEDITERKQAEETLFAEKERAQVTLHSIGDAVITTDDQGRVEYLNPVAETLTGWTRAAAKGKLLGAVFRIINEQSREPAPDPVARCLAQGTVVGLANHSVLLSRSGQEYAVEDSAAPIRGRDGTVLGVVLVFHDVTEARRLARQMVHEATHDTLTGLVNRREFEARLGRALTSARQSGKQHVICYLDLDQFKIVNDTAGHKAGDELLKQVKGLLTGLFRERDTLARLGGDEFGLLLDNCPLQQALVIAQTIIGRIRDYRFVWGGRTYQIGVSIGVVPITPVSETIDQLLSQADVACYIAKEMGRNRVHLYQQEGSEPPRRHSEILRAAGLREALEQERFCLYWQPVVSLAASQGPPAYGEILLRLREEDGALLMPGAFIPAAERYGLMGDIDRWVIQAVFRRCARGRKETRLAINLSGNSLNDESLLDFVQAQWADLDLSPAQFCFEITETAAIQNLDKAASFVTTMRKCGSRLALDDFGSGLSSFRYLQALPVDYLKIDGSFVQGMVENASDAAIVGAINHIGHTLGVRTVAEYVHSQAIVERLRMLGVDFAQGYALGSPTPWE